MGHSDGISMFWIVYLVILAATIAGMWKVFEKAGKTGWTALIPIYNLVVLLQTSLVAFTLFHTLR